MMSGQLFGFSRRSVLVLLGYLFFFFFIVGTDAVIWVSPTGNGTGLLESSPLGDIQAAIDLAIANSDSVVKALPGTYTCSTSGNCNVLWKGHTISFISRDGPATTILDGGTTSNSAFLFSYSGDNPTITGFTIKRFAGGAIVADGGGLGLNSFTMTNCIMTNNYPAPAPTINLVAASSSSSLTINNTVISDNQGYAVKVAPPTSNQDISPTLVMHQCRISGNSASGFDGSVYVAFGNLVTTNIGLAISDTNFINNAGGVNVGAGSLSLTNVNFYKSAPEGTSIKAVRCTSSTVVSKSNVNFCGRAGNGVTCTGLGGSGWPSSPLPTLVAADGCGVCNGNNTVKDCAGTCFGTATGCPAKKTWYVSPTGTGNGTSSSWPLGTISAAISAASYGDQIVLLNGTYSGPGNRGLNTAGKAIMITSWDGLPQFVTIESSYGVFTLNNSESYDTVIRGIIFTTPNNTVLASAISLLGASPTIQNCWFKNLTLAYNGGVAISGMDTFARIVNSWFVDNKAAGPGGAIAVAADVVTNPIIFTITNCRFIRNTADTTGGAISIGSYGNLVLTGSSFINNHAVQESGAIMLARSGAATALGLTAIDNSFFNNTCGSTGLCSSRTVMAGSSPSTTLYLYKSGNTFCPTSLPTTASTVVKIGSWTIPTGLAQEDDCGVCGGGNASKDCAGVCWGFSVEDSATPTHNCCLQSQKDSCGICHGPGGC